MTPPPAIRRLRRQRRAMWVMLHALALAVAMLACVAFLSAWEAWQ